MWRAVLLLSVMSLLMLRFAPESEDSMLDESELVEHIEITESFLRSGFGRHSSMTLLTVTLFEQTWTMITSGNML